MKYICKKWHEAILKAIQEEGQQQLAHSLLTTTACIFKSPKAPPEK